MNTFKRRVIIPGSEALGYLLMELRVYLGPAAEYCNLFEFIECLMNEIICDSKGLDSQHAEPFMQTDGFQRTWIKFSKTPDEIIGDYGIPTDIVYGLYAKIKVEIERQIYQVFGGLDETMDYRFYLQASGDIVLEEHTPPRQRQFNVSPSPPIDDFIESVRQGLENGDWYPENIRRLVRG